MFLPLLFLTSIATQAQALGRLKIANSYLLLLHARLVGLGKRFDRTLLSNPSIISSSSTRNVLHCDAVSASASASSSDYKGATGSDTLDIPSRNTTSTGSEITSQYPSEKVIIRASCDDEPNGRLDSAVSNGSEVDDRIEIDESCKAASKVQDNPLVDGKEGGNGDGEISSQNDEMGSKEDTTAAAVTDAKNILKRLLRGGNGNSNDDEKHIELSSAFGRQPLSSSPSSSSCSPSFRSTSNALSKLASVIPSEVQMDDSMMQHLAKAAMDLHRFRTGREANGDADGRAFPRTNIGTAGDTSTVAWTNDERERCKHAADRYGRCDAKQIALAIGTRTEAQVRAHLRNIGEKERATMSLDKELTHQLTMSLRGQTQEGVAALDAQDNKRECNEVGSQHPSSVPIQKFVENSAATINILEPRKKRRSGI